MTSRSAASFARLGLAAGLLALVAIPGVQADDGESVALATVLPESLTELAGTTIDDPVQNDGLRNRYVVRSAHGDFEVDGTPALCKLVRELDAVEEISKLKKTSAFSDSAIAAAKDLGTGARNLVTRPTETLGAAAKGLGKVFGRVGTRLVRGDERSDSEDGELESIIGFSKVKRGYAYDLGIDVYSDNAVLQEHLDQLAWTGYSGSVAFNIAATVATGGLAGAALTVSNYSFALEQLIRDSSPGDLRSTTRQSLLDQGVDSALVDLFVRNSVLSPRQQAFIAGALATMPDVSGKALLVRGAADATSYAEGFERQIQAQLYAEINELQPLARVVAVGPHLVAETAAGGVAVAATADYLRWTDEIAALFDDGNRVLDHEGMGEQRDLWLLNGASNEALQRLAELGWTSHTGMLGKLEAGRCDPNVPDLSLGTP